MTKLFIPVVICVGLGLKDTQALLHPFAMLPTFANTTFFLSLLVQIQYLCCDLSQACIALYWSQPGLQRP